MPFGMHTESLTYLVILGYLQVVAGQLNVQPIFLLQRILELSFLRRNRERENIGRRERKRVVRKRMSLNATVQSMVISVY